jgi:hypothetical protein
VTFFTESVNARRIALREQRRKTGSPHSGEWARVTFLRILRFLRQEWNKQIASHSDSGSDGKIAGMSVALLLSPRTTLPRGAQNTLVCSTLREECEETTLGTARQRGPGAAWLDDPRSYTRRGGASLDYVPGGSILEKQQAPGRTRLLTIPYTKTYEINWRDARS